MRRSKKFENFRVVGTFRALNLFLQIFLAATLFIGLNLIASRHYIKYDFSRSAQYMEMAKRRKKTVINLAPSAFD